MKIIVLGCGLVGSAMAKDLARDPEFEVSVADFNPANLDRISSEFPITQIFQDLSDLKELKFLIFKFDLVVNALPGFMGYQALKTIIESGRDVVDISFFPEDPTPLENLAKRKKITAIMDCGVAPGMSYILAKYAANKLDTCLNIEIYVGGLPKVRTLPFEYKAVFSPIDVIEEYTRPARYRVNNELIVKEALSDVEIMNFEGIGSLESFNSDGLRSLLKTIDCPNMIEKTLRYPGHVEKMKLLRDIGFFNQQEIEIGGKRIKPIEVTAKLMFPMWEMKKGDEDATVMKIIVEGIKGGQKKTFIYDLLDEFDSKSGIHSMARTTGYTATMAVRMLAKGLYPHMGLSYPEFIGDYPDCVNFILDGLKERGIHYKETIY